MEHIKIEIKGNVVKYAELTAEKGYCFYDKNDEQLQYLSKIITPILDEKELAETYCVVKGDADKLNEELEKQRFRGGEDEQD